VAANRVTVYLDDDLRRALRLKAAETGARVSTLINDAVRQLLSEDAEDLAAIRERRREPSRPFEEFLAELRRDGLL
jgi:predicted transcriptional regulator